MMKGQEAGGPTTDAQNRKEKTNKSVRESMARDV